MTDNENPTELDAVERISVARRGFLRTAAGVALAGAAMAPGAALAEPPATGPTTMPAGIRTGPYLQNPAADAMTVMWMTNTPSYGYVEYGLTAELGQRADADCDGMRQANNVVHRVRLTNLKAGTPYFYRVCARPINKYRPYSIVMGGEVDSPQYRFVTPDPAAQRVRFLVFNDLHDNIKLWQELYAIVKDEPVDFVFLNGDVTDFLQDEKQMVEHFLDICTNCFATSTPFLYTRGNHETRGAWAREMKQYLDLPGNRYYYALNWGPVAFVVLDSGEDKSDSAPVYAGLIEFDAYRAMQQEWLAKVVASDSFTQAPHRIAIHHIPAYYNMNEGPDEQTLDYAAHDLRNKWWPAFNQANVNLYIGGHTHVPTFKPANPAGGHNFPVMIGGGPRKGIGTVMIVEADAKNLRVKMLGDEGQTLATCG